MSRWPEGAVKTCRIEGCDNDGKITRGMCKMHYRRWERGTLDAPRKVAVRQAKVSRGIDFKFDMCKIDGVWHRRPIRTDEPWTPVVWPERTHQSQSPHETEAGW